MLVLGIVASSLVGGTSYALYRVAMGPEQCCKMHCRHPMQGYAAQRCCATHLAVTAAAGTADAPAKKAASLAPSYAGTLPVLAPPAPMDPELRVARDGRGPPGGSLVARHVSLLV